MNQRLKGWIGSRGWWIGSAVLHVAVLTFLLADRKLWVAPVVYPGDADGHRVVLTYKPGHAPAPSTLQASTHDLTPPPPTRKSLPAPASVAPSLSSNATDPAAAKPDSSTGSDALGAGNVTVALVLSHPPPHPDLSQLPHGTRGDVIVDVVIDTTGHIVKSTMEQGVGHGVDETVMATIQQWTFQPALRNGVPVASEQELLFHYERG